MSRSWGRCLIVAAMLAGCSDSSNTTSVSLKGLFEAVNGSGQAIDVYLGGTRVAATLAAGAATGRLAVPLGSALVEVRPAGGATAGLTRQVTIARGNPASLVVVDSSNVLNPIVLTDTGYVTPAGKSKLRVVHFATSAPPIDVYRTQPDFQQLITVMFPFPYKAASPFLQSDPGDWTIVVSHESQTDTLLATGPIAVGDGKARTVILVDQPGGGIGFAVVDEN